MRGVIHALSLSSMHMKPMGCGTLRFQWGVLPEPLFLQSISQPPATKNRREAGFWSSGRGDRIRTCDLYVPNVALYQTELHPDEAAYCIQSAPVGASSASISACAARSAAKMVACLHPPPCGRHPELFA